MVMTMSEKQAACEEETRSTIEALKHQETKLYSCCDYCQLHKEAQNVKSLDVDRKLMLKWSYNVVDFFNLDRETAAIAMSMSDRFLQTDIGLEFLQDTQKYQLLCIVCLYVAVKIHEPASLTTHAFVEISRGQYSNDEMQAMERLLLTTLQWRVNPPTALSFVRLFLDLIPSHRMDRVMKTTAYLLARAQTERALGDYQLVTIRASQIATASLRNSMDALGCGEHLAYYFVSPQEDDVLSSEQQEMMEALRIRLCAAITSHIRGFCHGSNKPVGGSRNSSSGSSKRRTNRDTPLASKNAATAASNSRDVTPRSVVCHTLASS